MSKPVVICLHSDSFDRIYQAVNTLLTAASAGQRCYLFLFYHALGAYMDGAWDDMRISSSPGRVQDPRDQAPPWQRKLERSFELGNLPSLYELLDRAKNAGGPVGVYACSNSTQYLGLDPADVKKRVDEIVGLATIQDISSDAGQVLYL